MFERCSRIADMIAPGGLKIAFIDREREHQDLNEFGQTLALSRGICVRLFAGIEEAERWLGD